MSKSKILSLIIFLLLMSTFSVFAQTPSQLFQQALLKENGEGDLKAAVAIYEKIVGDVSAERGLRAKAQLHIGMCWEKMGKQEASLAYHKVMEDFSDQLELVSLAKERLDQLKKGQGNFKSELGKNYKRIRKVEDFLVVLSPDHTYLAFPEKGQIWIREIGSGRETSYSLAEPAKHVNHLSWTSDSRALCLGNPDGCWLLNLGDQSLKQIAQLTSSKWYYDGTLKISLDGKKAAYISEGNLLLKDLTLNSISEVPHAKNVASFAWSLNGNKIAFTTTTSGNYGCENGPPNDNDALIYDLNTNQTKHLVDVNWDGNVDGWSNTGRWLTLTTNESGNCDIWIESQDGKKINVTQSPSYDVFPVWSADDRFFVFITDRNGSRELWFTTADGNQSYPIVTDVNVPIPIGWTDSNQFFYCTYAKNSDLYRIDIDPQTNQALGPPQKALPFITSKTSSASWSNDQQTLFFTHEKGDKKIGSSYNITDEKITEHIKNIELKRAAIPSPNGKFLVFSTLTDKVWCLVSKDLESGRLDTLHKRDGKIDLYDWSPDSKYLAFASVVPGLPDAEHPRRGRYDIYVTEVSTKVTTPLFEKVIKGSYLYPRWSPDGKKLAYTHWDEDKVADRICVIEYAGESLQNDQNVESLTDFFKQAIFGQDWSPTGDRIVFTTENSSKLKIVDVNTKQIKEIECGKSAVSEPAWSPDGRTIVYTLSEACWEIWMVEDFLPEQLKK